MKILLPLLVIVAIGASSVSAATGSTSTGSTSTWSTSTGSTSTGITLPTSQKGAGGPTRAWNYTTGQFEMYPQCFPYTWLFHFYQGNISMIYENQRICRENRTSDFGF